MTWHSGALVGCGFLVCVAGFCAYFACENPVNLGGFVAIGEESYRFTYWSMKEIMYHLGCIKHCVYIIAGFQLVQDFSLS